MKRRPDSRILQWDGGREAYWQDCRMANQYLSEELIAPAVGDIAVVTGAEARHAVTVVPT